MKKTKEVDYYECAQCNKEATYINKCSFCNCDLCQHCRNMPSISNYTFCSKCYSLDFQKVFSDFEKDWSILKGKQDIESDKLIKKCDHKIALLINETKENAC